MGRPFTIQLTEEQVALLHVRDIDPPKRKRQAPLSDPKAVYEVLKHLEALEQEHLVVLTLTSRQHLIERHVISVGVVDASLAHPREIFRAAILDNATKIILAHNHPSGDARPSEDDYLITKRLVAAGKVVGISVIDHVIIGAADYYSLQEHEEMR